jgi:hypothetical protein
MYATTKDDAPVKSMRSWKKDLKIAAKLSGFFVAGAVVVCMSQILAGIFFFTCIGAAGWACFEYGRKQN